MLVDLHRHLEGSIRPGTLLEIAREFHVPVPGDDLSKYVQMCDHDPASFLNFLGKFVPLRQFWVHREAIERVAQEAVQDAVKDGVTYLELRFSPVHFARRMGFDVARVADWIITAARRAADGIRVEFVATLNRSFDLSVNEPAFDVALKSGWFVGVDLAGDELMCDGEQFIPWLRRAKEKGLGVTIHAGEVQGKGGNVRVAIERFGADRIGHGTHALEDPQAVRLALERRVTFEVCLTSSRHTGSWADTATHPAKELFRRGVRVTLNTDDPSISRITLSGEHRKAVELGLFTRDQLARMQAIAMESAFPGR